MSKYKDIEGAVPVDGNLTPISRKPINQVAGDEWSDMSLDQLYEQRSMLQSRMDLAHSYSPTVIPAIKRGISQLDALIASKSTGDDTLI